MKFARTHARTHARSSAIHCALALVTLGASARAELPPPESDVYGDNVRVVRWDPPLEIPHLSRTARRWLKSATGGPLPAAIADAVYAERAARVGELLRSDDVMHLLALRPGVDVLRPLPHPQEAPALAFHMKELNSTLLGGVCKLLVTGGTQPLLGASLIQTFPGIATGNSLGASASGVVDRQLAYERLERLLLYTALYSKTVPSTFYDMIEVRG